MPKGISHVTSRHLISLVTPVPVLYPAVQGEQTGTDGVEQHMYMGGGSHRFLSGLLLAVNKNEGQAGSEQQQQRIVVQPLQCAAARKADLQQQSKPGSYRSMCM